MRKLLYLFIVPVALAFSQAPIKKDLFYLFSKVPAPPESGAQAYGGSDRNESGEGGDGSTGKTFAALRAEIKDLRDKITAGASGSMADMMKKAQQDPDAMEKMSEEDKMKMAQEMMKGMQTGPRVIQESPEVMNAFYAQGELMEQMGNETIADAQYRMQEPSRWERFQDKIREIDERTKKAILKKYPQAFAIGETHMSETELKAEEAGVREMLLKAWASEKIPLLNKELAAVKGEITKRATFWKTRLTPFNEALKKANYAADAKDQSMLQALGSGQGTILSAIEELVNSSSIAWEQTASCYAEKVKLDKESKK